jgi:hypothetical protein
VLIALALFAQIISAPALGAPVASFEQVLGGPNDASVGPLLHYQRCAGTTVDQFVLMAPGDQVWSIQRSFCELGSRSADDRFADAAQFLPADAVPASTFSTDLSEPAQTYTSPSLEAALPASLFHDCAGNSVPAGTLFVVADTLGGWYMAPGTCPGG